MTFTNQQAPRCQEACYVRGRAKDRYLLYTLSALSPSRMKSVDAEPGCAEDRTPGSKPQQAEDSAGSCPQPPRRHIWGARARTPEFRLRQASAVEKGTLT